MENLNEIIKKGFCVNLEELVRVMPHFPMVKSFGVKPGWENKIQREFDIFSYSFIVKGEGYYIKDEKRWEIEAPCILIQKPNHYYKYRAYGSWDEFYIVYDKDYSSYFDSSYWKEVNKPFVNYESSDFMLTWLQKLLDTFKKIKSFGMIDLFDYFTQQLLLEALIKKDTASKFEKENVIYKIRNYVDKNHQKINKVSELSEKTNYTARHLRRLWKKEFGGTIKEYILEKKMEHACYLLSKSNLQIYEIADYLGFSNQYYFSKKFKDYKMQTPSQYREENLNISINNGSLEKFNQRR